MRVVMLEEGERRSADEFSARLRDMTALLYRDAASSPRSATCRSCCRSALRGRHHGRQLGHLLPGAAAGAGGVGERFGLEELTAEAGWTPSGASASST